MPIQEAVFQKLNKCKNLKDFVDFFKFLYYG